MQHFSHTFLFVIPLGFVELSSFAVLSINAVYKIFGNMEVSTPDSVEYNFFPVPTLKKRVAIKAGRDAHVCFTSAEADTTPMVEILLGAWENTKSVIRFNREGPDKAEIDAPGLLTDQENREFTLEWTPNGTLFQVYGGADPEPFLSWRNCGQPFPVTHFGVRTLGCTGDWVCDDVNFMRTVDGVEYNYNPVEPVGGRLDFQVRAGNDAQVALTNGMEEMPIHEIIFGGSGNSRCGIQHNRQTPDVADCDIPQLLNRESYQSFWIKWSSRDIKVGIGNAPDPFMVWDDCIVHPVTHFGIRTTNGSDGAWIIPCEQFGISTGEETCGGDDTAQVCPVPEPFPSTPQPIPAIPQLPVGYNTDLDDQIQVCPCPVPYPTPEPPVGWVDPTAPPAGGIDLVGPATGLLPGLVPEDLDRTRRGIGNISLGGYDWVPSKSGGAIPADAVKGGQDGGEPIYVARGHHGRDLIPGKLLPSHRVTYVAWGGGEHAKESYEILVAPVSTVAWIPARGGIVPPNAIPGGHTETGETLFIGRVPHRSTLTIGKIHPSHGNLYIAYGGEEIGFPEYEVLVKK